MIDKNILRVGIGYQFGNSGIGKSFVNDQLSNAFRTAFIKYTTRVNITEYTMSDRIGRDGLRVFEIHFDHNEDLMLICLSFPCVRESIYMDQLLTHLMEHNDAESNG